MPLLVTSGRGPSRHRPGATGLAAVFGVMAVIAGLLATLPSPPADAQPTTCLGRPVTIVAQPGEVTRGTPGPDVILGTTGRDEIRGRGGDDRVCARGGADLVIGGAGADMIRGGPGADELRGGKGPDVIVGGGGDDEIWGKRGHDELVGGKGDDKVRGGNGNDRVIGGRGDDELRGGNGNDELIGRSGRDTLFGGSGNDDLGGGPGRDTCIGGAGDDTERGCEGPSTGSELVVSRNGPFRTLQAALNAVQPGQTILLADSGPTAGPVRSVSAGAPGAPITLTAAEGAYLECPSPDSGQVARCFQLSHARYVFDSFAIVGGSSNLYMVGDAPGSYVHHVTVRDSIFRGAPDGGTGECIRVKYQAYAIEIADNDIADCGLGKCCDDSKNGEGVYVGTAPEQLEEKNPSPEPDQTTDVWIHHNTIRSLNECVEGKEATYGILAEYNSCKGQQDEDSGGFGSRGGLVGSGNTFRFNLIEDTDGACVRFGGDRDPDGTGNDFYGNRCHDINGDHGVKQMRDPQGLVCGNTFTGNLPGRLSRNRDVDPTAPCPAGTPTIQGQPGAGRPNESPIDGF